MPPRKIVEIDESKCNGCGLCVPSCAEGAIQIIDGKARLVSEIHCDGLGACLGECPQGAIQIIEREALPFDEQAARQHVAGQATPLEPVPEPVAQASSLSRNSQDGCATDPFSDRPLGHWPIQLRLVPPNAPFLDNADLLLVADCVPFALADFHRRLLRRRPVVIGCPKLDDAQSYVDKLAAILRMSTIKSLTVVHMEVPCCTGLVRIAQAAMRSAGRSVPLEEATISIRGKIVPPEGS